MMLLYLGVNEEIVLTLNESITLESPEYVIVFVNDDTKKKIACKLGTDQSIYPERYNKFQITVQDSPEPLDAEVSLDTKGFYKYFVFEMADADTFDFAGVDDLDLSTVSGLVKRGKMEFIQSVAPTPYYKNNADSIKAYV